MDELRIFENEEFGSIRTITLNGTIYFAGIDVAKALGYSNTRDAISRHCRGVIKHDGVIQTTNQYGKTTNQKVEMSYITEGDIYRLIMRSQLPSAERFESWVCDEVIPSIRKNGGYISGQENMSDDELLEKALLVAQRKIAERDKMILEQNSKIQELYPKSVYFDAICDARLLTNFRDAAKELGMSQTQFTGYLKSNGYVYATSKGELRPTEPYRASDLFQMKSYVNPHNGFSGIRTYLTPKGVQYFKLAFEANGLIPDALPKHGGRNKNSKRIKA